MKNTTLMDLLIRNEDPKGKSQFTPTVQSSQRVPSKKHNDDLESEAYSQPMTEEERKEWDKTHKLGVPNG